MRVCSLGLGIRVRSLGSVVCELWDYRDYTGVCKDAVEAIVDYQGGIKGLRLLLAWSFRVVIAPIIELEDQKQHVMET